MKQSISNGQTFQEEALLDRYTARNVGNQTHNIAFQRTVIPIKLDDVLVQPDPENALEKYA
jgi:hypothetical protein